MSNNEVFGWGILIVFGFILSIWISYAIIRSANDTTTRNKIQLQNQQLLALLALKMGVDLQEVKKVVEGEDYRAPKEQTNQTLKSE